MWPELQKNDVALFAVSYDTVAVVAQFAQEYGIAYPLLADAGSSTIRDLGLLNEHLVEQHAAYGVQTREDQVGVAYPGVFVLDEAGVVVDKRFQQSFRDRETGTGLIEDALAIITQRHGSEATAEEAGVRVRAYLDSPSYRYFQRLRCTVELDIPHGYHVYANPVPPGYVPLHAVIQAPDGVTVGEVRWPEPRPFEMEGLRESFFIHSGVVRGSAPLVFAVRDAGDLSVKVTVSFQACNESVCMLPLEVQFELAVQEAELVGRRPR